MKPHTLLGSSSLQSWCRNLSLWIIRLCIFKFPSNHYQTGIVGFMNNLGSLLPSCVKDSDNVVGGGGVDPDDDIFWSNRLTIYYTYNYRVSQKKQCSGVILGP